MSCRPSWAGPFLTVVLYMTDVARGYEPSAAGGMDQVILRTDHTAVCNDGTPAVFYYREGQPKHRQKYVIDCLECPKKTLSSIF